MERFNALSRNGKIGVGCGGLIALAVVCNMCSQLLGGGSQPPPTPTPEVQPLVAPVDETIEVEATATDEPTDEPEPTLTEEPTDEPTAVPPTEVPTAAPPTAIPPTAAPVFAYDPPCQDTVNCADFAASGTDPQAWWNARRSAECPNPGRLDGNSNNMVCEDGEGGRSAAPPPAAPASGCVSFNSASFEDLRRIINVDDDIANQIIELRAQRPFSGWDDLVDRVRGIGDKNVEDIKAQGVGCF